MSVFGNANSIPPPLVLSLSRTLKGLYWDRIPGDNDDEVAARGIFYLVIFQQLGHLLRWSWGYHVLLAPKRKYSEYQEQNSEEGQNYRDEEEHDECEAEVLIDVHDSETECNDSHSSDSQHHEPAGPTPVAGHSQLSLPDLAKKEPGLFVRLYRSLPAPIQATLRSSKICWNKTINFLSEFMNPPLWAMLIAVLVASFPVLQKTLFEDEYIKNSVTSAIESAGNVAVPLMLVVLGANLARNTMVEEDEEFDPEEEKIGTKLLIAALVSRMLIPTVVLAPIMVITIKYLNVAILEDPIFIVVCFLLSGAPTGLQLAQICQINNVFEKTMDRILFQSYSIW